MLLAVAGIFLLGAPAARANGGVTFADNQPLVIGLTSCPCPVNVYVVNSAVNGKTVNVTLSIDGQASAYMEPGDAPPTPVKAGAGPVPVPVTVYADAVASAGTLVLTGDDGSLDREPVQLVGAPALAGVPPGALLPGTFDTLTVHATAAAPSFFRPPPAVHWLGILILIGTCIACAAAGFGYLKWRGTKSPWCTGALAFTAIGAGLATLVLLGAFAASGFGTARQSTLTTAPSWTISPAAPGIIEANLTGDNGQTGSLVARGPNLSIENVKYAGTYNGSINTQPAGANGTIKATLFVRDRWWYAFLAVAIGVVIGWALTWFYLRRPLQKLTADAAAAAAGIARHESDWSRQSAGQAWGRPYTLAGYAQGAVDKITAKAGPDTAGAAGDLTALLALDASLEGLRRQVAVLAAQRAAMCARYAADVTEHSVLDGPGWLAPLQAPLVLAGQGAAGAQASVDARAKAASGVADIADKAGDLSAQLDSLSRDIRLQGPLRDRWAGLVQDVLKAGDTDDKDPGATFTSIQERIKALRQDIAAAHLPAQEDLAAAQPSPGSPHGKTSMARHAWIRAGQPGEHVTVTPPQVVLNDAPGLNRDTLLTVTVQATGLAEHARVHWVFSDGTESATFPAPPPGDGGTTELSILHSFASGPQQATANVVNDRGAPAAAPWSLSVRPYSQAQRLGTALHADDRVVAVVAGVLAIGSGMEALYLNTPAWGSAGDYLTALLWGAVTSEGVKLIVNIARQQWPITS
jgi:hypothetical protein